MTRLWLAITLTAVLGCATDSAEQSERPDDRDPDIAAGCVVRVSSAAGGASIALADSGVRSSGAVGDDFALLSVDDTGTVLDAIRFGFDIAVHTVDREDGHTVRSQQTVAVQHQFVPLRQCADATRAVVIDRAGAVVAELSL